MIFVLSYDRQAQRLTHPVEEFPDERRREARERRLAIQLELPAEDGRYEVVLLEASSSATIRKTHARYFARDAGELIDQAQAELTRTGERLNKAKG